MLFWYFQVYCVSKSRPFYFLNNSVTHRLIFIRFDVQHPRVLQFKKMSTSLRNSNYTLPCEIRTTYFSKIWCDASWISYDEAYSCTIRRARWASTVFCWKMWISLQQCLGWLAVTPAVNEILCKSITFHIYCAKNVLPFRIWISGSTGTLLPAGVRFANFTR